jgi:hypothetical protein
LDFVLVARLILEELFQVALNHFQPALDGIESTVDQQQRRQCRLKKWTLRQ